MEVEAEKPRIVYSLEGGWQFRKLERKVDISLRNVLL